MPATPNERSDAIFHKIELQIMEDGSTELGGTIEEFDVVQQEMQLTIDELYKEPYDPRRLEAVRIAVDKVVEAFSACVGFINAYYEDDESRISPVVQLVMDEEDGRLKVFPDLATCLDHGGVLRSNKDAVENVIKNIYRLSSGDQALIQQRVTDVFAIQLREVLGHVQEHLPELPTIQVEIIEPFKINNKPRKFGNIVIKSIARIKEVLTKRTIDEN